MAPFPGVISTGNLANKAGSIKRNLSSDLNQGRKNPWHYLDIAGLAESTDIGDGTTDAREAILAADADGAIDVPAGTYAISDDLTLANPPTFQLGAKLKPADGKTITLNGYIAEDIQHVFDLSAGGTVTIAAGTRQYITPYHFGCNGSNDTAAFRAAIAAAINKFPLLTGAGTIDLSDIASPVSINGNLVWVGDGDDTLIVGPSITAQLFEVQPDSGATIYCESMKFWTWGIVFNLTGNTAYDPYAVTIRDVTCNNFGRGIIGAGNGVYSDFIYVDVSYNRLTDMGLDLDNREAKAIEVAARNAGFINVSNNEIDRVGSLDNTKDVFGILVDASASTDKLQPAHILNNVVKNVRSGSSLGEQVAGIMALDCHATIAGCIVDTVEAPDNPSSPEGIYAKCPKATIANCSVIDTRGAEGCFNLKGETSESSANHSLVYGNKVIFRIQPVVGNCNGFNIASGDIIFMNNYVEGCTRGAVIGFNGCTASGNVFKNIALIGIEFQPQGDDYVFSALGNTFDGIGYAIEVTLDHTTNTFTAENHGRSNTEQVVLSGSLPSEFAAGVVYFVRDKTDDTFRLATTSGGTAIDFTSDGTDVIIKPAVAYGILYSQAGEEATKRLHTEGNIYRDFQAGKGYGIRVIQTSSNPLESLLIRNETFFVSHPVAISTTGSEVISNIEFCYNTIWGAEVVFASTAKSSRFTKLGNTEDGLPWIDNTTALDFDLRSLKPAVLWDFSDTGTITEDTGASNVLDKSGNGYHLSQANTAKQPLLADWGNGLNCLEFDGSNDCMDIAALPQSKARFFVVVADTTNLGTSYRVFLKQDGTGTPAFYFGTSTNYKPGIFWSGEIAVQNAAIQKKAVFEFFAGPSTGETRLNDDDATLVSTTGNSTLGNWITLDSDQGAGQNSNVKIAIAIGFATKPADAYLRRLYGYLAYKWGLQSELPTNHPHKVLPPLL